MVYNGKPTQEWLTREDSMSPTAALESIMLTVIVDAKEGCNVMSCNIPNAFIQAKLPNLGPDNEQVIMKITGVLVDLLANMSPEVYGPYVVMDKHKGVIYVQVLRGLYGMLISSIIWYAKLQTDLEGNGYIFNPYDPCNANKIVRHKRHTIRFHVDGLMCSHKDPEVNNEIEKWLNKTYRKHRKVTTHHNLWQHTRLPWYDV
jgi:hypothetical protein